MIKEKKEKRQRITLFACLHAGILFFSLCSFLFAPPFIAAATINNQPVRIRAQEIEMNQKTGNTVYRGKVSIQQGKLRINADLVKTKIQDGQTLIIRAFGKPVVLRHNLGENSENIYASANRMVFHVLSGKIKLHGRVFIKKGSDTINSDTVVYHTATNIIFANANSPDSTVQTIIYPGSQGGMPSLDDATDRDPRTYQ